MALIKCPECGKEVSDNASSCPNCGFPIKEKETLATANIEDNDDIESPPKSQTPKKKHGCLVGCLSVIIASVVFVGVMLTIANNSTKIWDSTVVTGIETNKEAKQDLELVSFTDMSENGLRYVTGEIRNNTDKNYSYIQVEINMQKDDLVLGSTLANVNNIGPGETWKFKALITDNECNKYTIKGITGF